MLFPIGNADSLSAKKRFVLYGEDLAYLFVLGCIDDLPFLIQVGHTLLGEGGTDDISGQVFHGRFIVGRNAVAAEDVEPEKTPPIGARTFARDSILHRY